ncbi:MAG: response regulator, partial [Planctomycetes bacterium]|nr:response regulator [Planctomycetota bacterium]
MTGGIAHDFNNLQGVMIGNAELLGDRIGEDEKAKHNISELINAVTRAASLTGRLLAFSRQQILNPETTAINGLVLGLEDILQRTIGGGIELRIQLGPGNCSAMIDHHQFENALLNLAINARDAMQNGGTILIQTAEVILDETYTRLYEETTPGNYIQVTVTDTGTGMPPEILEKVFEPFFTTKEVGKGSGLGLSMVYGFAKQSGGHITIDSEVGHGTTVNLYMPRSENATAPVNKKTSNTESDVGSERILIVEDDESVREIPVFILAEQGYEVVEVGDGHEAIRLLKDAQPFDLLFTDVELP